MPWRKAQQENSDDIQNSVYYVCYVSINSCLLNCTLNYNEIITVKNKITEIGQRTEYILGI